MLYHRNGWSDLDQISVYTIQVKYGEYHGSIQMTLRFDLQGQIPRSSWFFAYFLLIFSEIRILDTCQLWKNGQNQIFEKWKIKYRFFPFQNDTFYACMSYIDWTACICIFCFFFLRNVLICAFMGKESSKCQKCYITGTGERIWTK